MKYELTYRQPYEFDEDSPSGIGDHSIEFSQTTYTFETKSDEEADEIATKFLSEGAIIFTHYLDGDGKTYRRQLVRLVRIL